MSHSILQIQNLSKTYQSGSRQLTVLHDVSFSLETGATCSIVGPSGSGKTTLLGLCAGLDRATSGSVILNGVTLDNLSEDERAEARGQHVGFIFQSFNLMPTLTALENVMVPLELQGKTNVSRYALELLDKVGLADRLHHYPSQLSGGEQQRVAIARALVGKPDLLIADEPTGNVDPEMGMRLMRLFWELSQRLGASVLIATHDLSIVRKLDAPVLRLQHGLLVRDAEHGMAS